LGPTPTPTPKLFRIINKISNYKKIL